MERRADDAERELVQWKKVRFMADKVGDEFDGYITGVAAFGLFIELTEHFVEGLVHISSMADDYYRFLEATHTLRGENTHKVYRLGDRVRVQVVRVDMERRQIDLGLVEVLDALREDESKRGPKRSKARPKAERSGEDPARANGNAPRARPCGSRRAAVTGTPMRSVVIGTAGHIDHGKSSLVRALTGTDPDRLKEEKARGITIDLGFAHWTSGDVHVAFVDVPGHERFVRNMLAGAGGIDAVLLVVAADESIMPQTREHFEICRLLGVTRGLTALTKADLVDDETLQLVRLEVADLLEGTPLETAAMIPVSSRTGQGLDSLRSALVSVAGEVRPRAVDGPARLPIDRAFTMKGFGTVVTGTLVSGRIRAGRRAPAAAGRPRGQAARPAGAWSNSGRRSWPASGPP